MKRGMMVDQLTMVACDMGASNGRIVYGTLKDGKLNIRELHRFENKPVRIGGILYWDFLKLFQEIKDGLTKVAEEGLTIDSLGLNSWGNTVGLLDRQGDLLLNPYHYRDNSPTCVLPMMQREIPLDKQFSMTLFKPMDIQPTVFLKYLKEKKPEVLSAAGTVLMISDLFNYYLTGKMASEVTMAATSQLLDMRTREWSREYWKKLKFPELFPEIVSSGTQLGTLREELVTETGLFSAPEVIAVTGHDTAAASACANMESQEDSLYLSCGTWSCMGCLADRTVEDVNLFLLGMTNDLGACGKRNLRFNHTGLWILQECKREWDMGGRNLDWNELIDLAEQAPPFYSFIDTESQDFFSGGQMVKKVREYCRRTGQRIPETVGEVVRMVCESLALRYRFSRDSLERYSGVRFRRIQIFGGGSRNRLLCRSTADALGIPVTAGPVEASISGNFIQQGMAAGMVQSLEDGRSIIERSWNYQEYQPEKGRCDEWEDIYQKMKTVFGWKS